MTAVRTVARVAGFAYTPRPGDAVWTTPPSGWAWSRSADPSNAVLPDAVLLRGGGVYYMRRVGTQFYTYIEPRGDVLLGPAITGMTQPAFLSEQRFRWRLWAVDNALDPDAPSPNVAPWAVFNSIDAAAPYWQWTRVR